MVNQAIIIPQMKVNLLATMQMHDNDLHVNDEPKSMVPRPMEDNHAIVVPVDDDNPLQIPLWLNG